MNPLTNVKNLNKINERELNLGVAGDLGKSWHKKYQDSAWIFIGGLPYDLTEGDVIAVFSQYGEIVNINLIRDHKTGKIKGFGFLCYEDQRSTVLAVDNFNGTKVLGRIIRVDHVEEYKVPKERGDEDELVKQLHLEGCAPRPVPILPASSSHKAIDQRRESKKVAKKLKKEKKHRRKRSRPSSSSSEERHEKKKKKRKAEKSDEKINQPPPRQLEKPSTSSSSLSKEEHLSQQPWQHQRSRDFAGDGRRSDIASFEKQHWQFANNNNRNYDSAKPPTTGGRRFRESNTYLPSRYK